MNGDLIVNTTSGLHCPAGGFYIDAWKPVDRNIVTHAHSDHARRGSKRYLAHRNSAPIMKHRLRDGQGEPTIDTVEYGEELELNGVRVSLHPAGHVLGSSQIRVEHAGEVWVISGDYKRDVDTTCTPFEPIRCNTFITECTFGLPIFHWRDPTEIATEINDWWRENVAIKRTSILLAYSLGKAQRVLAGLDPSIGPILLHGAVVPMVEIYRQAGVALPQAEYATLDAAKALKGSAIVIAPPSALGSPWVKKFAPFSVGVASGWMQVRGHRRRRGADRGFILSDHVDFPSLLRTIEETGASRVIATHGYTAAMSRLMREHGKDSEEFATHFGGDVEDVPEGEAEA